MVLVVVVLLVVGQGPDHVGEGFGDRVLEVVVPGVGASSPPF